MFQEKFHEQFQHWIDENRLLRIEVIYRKTGRKTIIGKLLQFNPHINTLLVYTEDQKTVESININQIDDIFPAG